jgi:hypothetical protein
MPQPNPHRRFLPQSFAQSDNLNNISTAQPAGRKNRHNRSRQQTPCKTLSL